MTYQQVTDALKTGADPAMLCMTCPWDRFCISPPSMTAAEVEARMEEAKREDEHKAATARAAGKDVGMPVAVLVTAMAVGGRDTAAQVCPVLAMRLRLPEGREIVDLIRSHMRRDERS